MKKVTWITPFSAGLCVALFFAGCGNAQEKTEPSAQETTKEQASGLAPLPDSVNFPLFDSAAVLEIKSFEQFRYIVEKLTDKVLIFDLYADWCRPCRILSPMLDKMARDQPKDAYFYKVDVDALPIIAGAFGVQGIPYVVFIKNKKAYHAMAGVQPEANYLRAIDMAPETEISEQTKGLRPDGELQKGVRVITLPPPEGGGALGDIYVYRGETVRLTIPAVDFHYAVHIPDYDVSREGTEGAALDIEFKADRIGVFPIYCNGDCPEGDGAQFGRIMVLQYASENDGEFVEITAKDASEILKTSDALLLDVRTPREYYAAHIDGAMLMPLDQLEGRLKEIEQYKDSVVVVYCRSGNRSTVASQILIRNGFTKIKHIRPGLIGWRKEGLPVIKKQ